MVLKLHWVQLLMVSNHAKIPGEKSPTCVGRGGEKRRLGTDLMNVFENVDFFEYIRISFVKSSFSRVGGSVWELRIDSKRLRGEIKNNIDAPQAIFGSKKRAKEAEQSSKTNLETLFGRSRGPKEPRRYPQELPKAARQSTKTLSEPSLGRNIDVSHMRFFFPFFF